MPKVISSTELRNSYNDVSTWCHHNNEPAFVFLLSLQQQLSTFLRALQMRLEMYEFIEAGRKDILAGHVISARDHVASLREKYGL